MKLKPSYFDESHKLKFDKTKNLNCDETWKLKLWWNSKTLVVIKLKISNSDEIQKIKFWWNSKTLMMKLKNSNCNEAQNSHFYETQKF